MIIKWFFIHHNYLIKNIIYIYMSLYIIYHYQDYKLLKLSNFISFGLYCTIRAKDT